MRRLAVLFVLAAVLSGCYSKESGTPSAGDQTGATPTTGTSARSTPVNRPKAVDMQTLDPCTLFTQDIQTSLGLILIRSRAPLAEYGEGSKTCGGTYEDRKYDSSIFTLVNGGVDRLKRTVGEANLTPLQVAGYPAYLAHREAPGSVGGCDIYIDANDEQMLLVDAVASFTEEGLTLEVACERATKLANAVGAVLVTK